MGTFVANIPDPPLYGVYLSPEIQILRKTLSDNRLGFSQKLAVVLLLGMKWVAMAPFELKINQNGSRHIE